MRREAAQNACLALDGAARHRPSASLARDDKDNPIAPGLRLMLKMMRAPAAAAGLASLQGFLEAGFDTFGAMARKKGDAESFLHTVAQREAALITMLFDAQPVACETELQRTLGLAR